jgi:hypothetical protein
METEVGALPDGALADVFRGLPLRSLAVVRCVCKAWRDVVDARALLLPHLHLHGRCACFHQGLVNGRRGLLSGKECRHAQSRKYDWI